MPELEKIAKKGCPRKGDCNYLDTLSELLSKADHEAKYCNNGHHPECEGNLKKTENQTLNLAPLPEEQSPFPYERRREGLRNYIWRGVRNAVDEFQRYGAFFFSR